MLIHNRLFLKLCKIRRKLTKLTKIKNNKEKIPKREENRKISKHL